MDDHPTAGTERAPGALRAVALTAAVLGVLVLLAAAFLLSYAGVHDVARQAGVSTSMAKVYPVILDAMVVIAVAALLALRGAGLAVRSFAWLILLVLLAAAAGADVLHATGNTIPHHQAEITAAVLPWALVLIGIALLLTMLRQAGRRRAGQARAKLPSQQDQVQPEPPALALPGQVGTAGSQPARPVPAQPEPAQPEAGPPGGAPRSADQTTTPAEPEAGLQSLLPQPLTSVRGEPRPADAPTTPWSTLPADPAPPSLPVRRPGQHGMLKLGRPVVQRQTGDQSAADTGDDGTEPGLDDPTSDEATAGQPANGRAGADGDRPQPAQGPVHTLEPQDPGPEPGGPVFHRIVSVPEPPDEGNA
jgi:hypothetical protein